MKLAESGAPLSTIDLDILEKNLSEKLPESLKEFYLENNGGFPEENFVRGINNIFSFDGFIPIKFAFLTAEKIMEESSHLFHGQFFPFANDWGGNVFHIALHMEMYGQVFLITSDTRDIFIVQNSFAEFLENLYLENDS